MPTFPYQRRPLYINNYCDLSCQQTHEDYADILYVHKNGVLFPLKSYAKYCGKIVVLLFAEHEDIRCRPFSESVAQHCVKVLRRCHSEISFRRAP